MVIVDTSVIIDHLRQPEKKTLLLKIAEKKPKRGLAVSTVTIQELYEGRSTRDKEEEQFLWATITPMKILPYNLEVAKKAGEIARDRKNPIEFADAAIAATAFLNDARIFTLNEKYFGNIKGVEIFNLDNLNDS